MTMPHDLTQRALQIFIIVVVIAGIGYFADNPGYRVTAQGKTELRLVIRHSGILLGECERQSAEDLDSLPANMRQPMSCPREKSPLSLELRMNDAPLFRGDVHPSGLHDDGVLALYREFSVPTGTADVALMVKDQVALENYNHRLEKQLDLSRDSVLLVSFTDQGISFIQPGL